ncbi:putative metal-binding motif-containing protein [Candidatus Woesearchaeota archaeon]|nr:putative metal-binding motif-containing protein [Candidatus Woesearchaeota archaeon]
MAHAKLLTRVLFLLCNDNNPSVWSLNSCGACAAQPSEIQCNGVDDDCSGGDYCPCTDSDGDTYYSNAVACGAGSSKQDCNDANININPGATDICGNGIDENCFAGDATCPCSDKDGDGYGSPGAGTCLGGSATDCNDNNAAINPGATDICGNGVDENCFAGDAKCSCGNGILDPGEVCE